jgi:hypothetical protein
MCLAGGQILVGFSRGPKKNADQKKKIKKGQSEVQNSSAEEKKGH